MFGKEWGEKLLILYEILYVYVERGAEHKNTYVYKMYKLCQLYQPTHYEAAPWRCLYP